MAGNPFLPLDAGDRRYIAFLCAFVVVIILLWLIPAVNVVLKPLKLLVIAIHEFSHALAGVLTGATIEGIEVHADEGGVTKMRGGVRWVTLPAGYLGSSLWGGAMIFFARSSIGSQVVAGCLIAAMVLVLFWADTWLTRFLALLFAGIVAGFWVLHALTAFDGLPYVVLFVGVMTSLYAIFDVYDDLIRRKVRESDASMFARECPCLPAQGWGLLWGVLALAATAGSAALALLAF